MMRTLFAALAASSALTAPAIAEDYFVRDQAAYDAIHKDLEAGDTVILANGEWNDFEIVVVGQGTEDAPISLRAEEPGKVILTGQSNLRIGGRYIHVSGLVFRDGYSPTGEVISFRRTKGDLAYHSRVSDTVIDGFSKPDRYESDYWVGIYGKHNRFNHNHLVGKTNKGVTLAVRLDSEESRENYHRIDHNYFGPRPTLGSNGGETLRVGTSHYAHTNSNTLVENNIFDRTDGEVEIISSKAGANIYRGNVFLRAQGTLTLRHGDGNLVERNIFLGDGKDHTGGIRVINRDQVIRNNYMEGLRGIGFGSAFTVMNGVPNSPANRYVQVTGALIERNSVLDSYRITLGAGADEERSAAPDDSVMRGNLFSGTTEPIFRIDADISGIERSNNVLAQGQDAARIDGIESQALTLVRAANGLLYPEGSDIGAPRDLDPVSLDDVGVAWYAKPGSEGPFGHGRSITVEPGDNALSDAIAMAADGDVLMLQPGVHVVSRTIALDKALTFQGSGSDGDNAAIVQFSRPSLIELQEGGSIRFERLVIDGSQAPDNVGNSVIKTPACPIQSNFSVEMDHVLVRDLDVNRHFNVITIGKSAFADRVTITDSQFEDVSGVILKAAAETDDFGQYNVEYFTVTDTRFERIGGPVADIYRGGRDESTFGPHVTIANSTFSSVGTNARDGGDASLRLWGAQDTHLSGNIFEGSAPVRITHTVGTPKTQLEGNQFNAQPVLVEHNHSGAFRLVGGGI